jgi:hypothetical protein
MVRKVARPSVSHLAHVEGVQLHAFMSTVPSLYSLCASE